MKILLDNQELNIDKVNSLTEILEEIREDINDKIISEIYINGNIVTEEELINFDLNEVKSIEFLTKKSIRLVEETLTEANNYLPKLKKGFIDIANLFRDQEIIDANEKLQLCLDGVKWYTGVLMKILSLVYGENQEISEIKKLEEFNTLINKSLDAMEEDDWNLVANILEDDISIYIDEFIKLNNNLLEHIK
ncbi:hypothetical protein BX659_104139 [Orenia metallireducens]|uniref:DUF8042 domain-containing protein n=1 Tax=Orenia metallireducens TaxID=1413210 RepID=A0A285GAZ8_9FIRM|nr:hypothetical protein [Orenia metallireducens]PRX32590.1 hypothetical protein BX659_104139 [Orenia metallireducens]SNY20750.1 hypothetical protein SAMN06265827_10610 [Orenia metallireducens]